jgi:hypothetical protein
LNFRFSPEQAAPVGVFEDGPRQQPEKGRVFPHVGRGDDG